MGSLPANQPFCHSQGAKVSGGYFDEIIYEDTVGISQQLPRAAREPGVNHIVNCWLMEEQQIILANQCSSIVSGKRMQCLNFIITILFLFAQICLV